MRGQPGHNTRPHTRLTPSSLDMDAWMTSQTYCSFDSQATWVIDVLGLFFDMLSMDLTTYNQALVLELNVCTDFQINGQDPSKKKKNPYIILRVKEMKRVCNFVIR